MEQPRTTNKSAVVPGAVSASRSATPETKHEKRQVITNQVEEVELRETNNCASCGTPVNRNAREKPEQGRQHKLCRSHWNLTPQNGIPKHLRAETGSTGTSSTPDLNNGVMPCQESGATNRRSKSSRRNNRTLRSHFQIPISDKAEITMIQLNEGAAVVLDHHIFDPKTGWVKERAWRHPTLRLIARPCQEMYSKLDTHCPKAVAMIVHGIADTGAQICLWSAADCYESGYKESDLIMVKQKISAVNRQPIGILGAVFLAVEAGAYATSLMALVTPEVEGLYLSRQVLTALYVIPKSFPTAGDAKVREGEEGTVSTVASTASIWAPCGCLQRQAPPRDPMTYHFRAKPKTSAG